MPERELFIRWLELTAFLPAMQFSISPWQYDPEVVRLSREYVTLHETTIYEEIVRSSESYVAGNAELGAVRPIWWVVSGGAKDQRAYEVDDQFMVGDRYLVAPVVENGTRHRDVYLPGPDWREGDGKQIWWKSMLRAEEAIVLGGRMLFDYPVALEEVAWWEMVLV